jgi:dipeptidyl aminopeptidase/acylaminoacyl peptidase
MTGSSRVGAPLRPTFAHGLATALFGALLGLAAPVHAQPVPLPEPMLLANPASNEPAPPTPPSIELEAAYWLQLRTPSAPVVSPGGDWIAFVVTQADVGRNVTIGDVWIARVGTNDAPERVTTDLLVESAPSFSPDGRHLAFLSRRRGGRDVSGTPLDSTTAASAQVWIVDVAAVTERPTFARPRPDARRLTAAPEGVHSYDWTTGGVVYRTRAARSDAERRRLADDRRRGFDAVVHGPDPRPWEFWFRPVEPNAVARRLLTADAGVGDWDVSTDGARLVYASHGGDPLEEESPTDLWMVEFGAGGVAGVPPTGAAGPAGASGTPNVAPTPRRVTHRWGPDTHPVFSPDGQWIAWLADQDSSVTYSQEELFVAPVSGTDADAVCLTRELDRPIDNPVWRADGAGLWIERIDGEDQEFVSVSFPPGERGVASLLSATTRGPEFSFHSELSRSSDGGVLAWIGEGPAAWPDVWVALRDGVPARRTDLNPSLRTRPVPRLERRTLPSFDGLPISGVLISPPAGRAPSGDRGPHPLVVFPHGGPYNRSTLRLRAHPTALALAARGYAVYSPNFRGSRTGTHAFGTALRGDFVNGPYRDVMAGVDALIAAGVADSSRLAIMGGSYGGYLAMWAITRTDRFKAAASMYGMSSLVTDFGNGRHPSYELEYLGEPYWKGNPLWTAQSPAWFADRIRTPLLLLHGEEDGSVGISNSREMWTALTVLRRPVEFVRYPRAGHGFHEPNHRIDATRRLDEWLSRWLR